MSVPPQGPRRPLVSVLKNAPAPIAYTTTGFDINTNDDVPELTSALSQKLVGRDVDKTYRTRKRPSEDSHDRPRDENDDPVVYEVHDQIHDGDLEGIDSLPTSPRTVKKKVRFLEDILSARRRTKVVPFNPIPPPPLPFNPELPPQLPFNPNPPPPPPPPELPCDFFYDVPETDLPNGLLPPPSPPQILAEPLLHPPLPPSIFDTLPDPPPLPLSVLPSMPHAELPPPPPPLATAPPTAMTPPYGSLPQLTPPIFTSTSEGDTYVSRAAFKLYQKFVVAVSDFVELQGNVTRKRVEVQERRTICRLQRGYIHQCDQALIEHLRTAPTNKRLKKDAKLAELFEESQRARDEAIPLEDHYEALEVELGAAEYSLKEKFGPLVYRFENLFSLDAATSVPAVPSALSNFSFISSDQSSNQDPDQGLVRVGWEAGDGVKVGQIPTSLWMQQNPSHAREQPPSPRRPPRLRRSDGGSEPLVFPSLQMSSVDPLAPRTIKPRPGKVREQTIEDNIVGVGGHEEIREWRRSERSTETPGSLKRKVSSLDGEASRTSTVETGQAREQQVTESLIGIGDFSAPDIIAEEGDENAPGLDDFSDWPFQEGPHRYFAHISQQAGDDETLLLRGSDGETQSTLSDYLMVFDSTRERVNKWLLHKLRVSPLEVFELQGRVRATSQNVPDWERRALNMWDSDGYELGMAYDDGSIDESENTKEFSVPTPYPTIDEKPNDRMQRSDRRMVEIKQTLLRGTAVPLDKSQLDLAAIDLIVP